MFACLRNAGQEVTSTSVTTGNPSGIRIAFRKDSIPVALNGKIEIFASDQIPVSGYSPNPLISIVLIGDSIVEIENQWIESIPDSLWPTESIEGDSIRRINAVISSDSLGSILKGITFQKSKVGFRFFKSNTPLTQVGFYSELPADLNRLTDYITKTDTNRLSFSSLAVYHLFIYGTGFTAKGEGGVFKIPRLPLGQHEAFLISLPGREHQTSGRDSTSIFTLIGGINTSVDSIYRGPEHAIVELPDSLKYK